MRYLDRLSITLVAACVTIGTSFVAVDKAEATEGVILLRDSFGVFLDDMSTILPVGGLVQLVWSADAAYHPANEGSLDSAGYLASGDYILFSTFTPSLGGWGGDLDGSATYTSNDVDGTTELPSGFVYARVFDFAGASPTQGNWFLQTALIPLTQEGTNLPPPTGDEVNVAPGGGTGPGGGSSLDMQVLAAVPEPGTLAGMGMGLLAIMFWRSRRRV